MVKEKEALIANVLKTIDAIVVIFSFGLAYFVDYFFRTIYDFTGMAFAEEATLKGLFFFSEKNIALTISFVPVWLFLLNLFGAYKDFRTRAFYKDLAIIIKSALLSIIVFASIFFMTKMQLTSRLYIAIFIITTALNLMIEKRVLSFVLDYMHEHGFNQINLLVVGTGKRAQRFIRVLKEHSNWGLRIVGLIDDEHDMYGKEVEGYRVLGRLQDIPFIIHRKVIDRVIFVVPRLWLHRLDDVILACEREGIATSISMDLYDLKIAEMRQSNFSGFPLLEFETFRASVWQLFFKRVADVFLSLIFMIILLPILSFF